MMTDIRFSAYRNLVGLLVWGSFKAHRIHALKPPRDGAVRFRPYAQAFPRMPLPRLYDAQSFPRADHPAAGLFRFKVQKAAFSVLRRIAPPQAPPVPRHDPEGFLDSVYPSFFRRVWPRPPRVPSELKSRGPGQVPDVLARLAVRGPFGSYLRRASEDEVRAGEALSGDYVVDLSWMLGYRARGGLLRPGGKAVLSERNGGLFTAAIHRKGVPGGWEGAGDAERTRAAFLAGLNEDLTTFRHNLSAHLAILTPFALATTNRLGAKHPVRRLLHHCFHTVLIGNRELGEFQLSGPEGFAATIFSHDHQELARMVSDYLRRFDFWDFEPVTQFSRRGTLQTPFAYPYRDNMLQLWAATHAYVAEYLRLYYAGDAAVGLDAELTAWIAELERLVPNGVRPLDGRVTRDWLTRLCATLIHVSTVEHDILNNVAWDYSTLSWIIPTAVPISGAPMDQRRAFDLITTLIGTWKPYNMLIGSELPSLALDPRGRRVMERWLERLRRIQEEMARLPPQPELTYPANLNVSLSN